MSGSYRLYILDKNDHGITQVIEVGYQDSDEAALKLVAHLLKLQPAELWDCGQKVYQYEPPIRAVRNLKPSVG